ncbi:MAG: DUF1294 domain-containing protein [Candidatus Moranbacteria bacterium]|nr:DUF1294 domain-containing protein [Candidatus Moranbacteria bacterium]
MDQILLGLAGFFLLINMGAFSAMAFDKRRSRKSGAERIPEGLLFFLAAAFGGIGVCFGMLVFRHKTQKWYFTLGIPLLILENVVFLMSVSGWLERM